MRFNHAFRFQNLVPAVTLAAMMISLSSCGKSKIEKKNANAGAGTVVSSEGGGRAQGRTAAPQTQPGVSGAPEGAPAPAQSPAQDGRSGRKRPPVVTQPNPGTHPAPRTGVPTPGVDDRAQAGADAALNTGEIKFNESNALLTGGTKNFGSESRSGKTMFYTGFGDDGVLERLQNLIQQEAPAQRTMNLAIASSIKHAKVSQSSSGEETLTLTIEYAPKVRQTVRLQSTSTDTRENPKSLEVMKGRVPAPDEGLHAVSGALVCLDKTASANCAVQVAQVKFTNGSAYIIFRKGHASAHMKFAISEKQESAGVNPNFARIRDYVRNRVEHIQTDQKVRDVVFSSFEIVGGESDLGLIVRTTDQLASQIRAPLLANENGVSVNQPAKRINQISRYFDFAIARESAAEVTRRTGDFFAGVESIRLVNNNGRGDLRLLMTFPHEDTSIELTLSRRKVAIDAERLTQISL